MNRLPQELVDRIVLFVEAPESKDTRANPRSRHVYSRDAVHRLGILRLVNKALCHSASFRFHRVIFIVAPEEPAKCNEVLRRLHELFQGPYASAVQDLQMIPTHYNHTTAVERAFYETLLTTIHDHAVNLVGLRSLGMVLAQQLQDLCVDIFKSILLQSPLRSLEEIALVFDSPDGYIALLEHDGTTSADRFRAVLRATMARLEQLSIGDAGILEYVYSFSSQQLASHAAYSHPMFELISMADRLEHLRIDCQRTLSTNMLDTTRMHNLHSVSLLGAVFTSDQLLSLFEKCQRTLRYAKLIELKLTSSSWAEILLWLSRHATLEAFKMSRCGYISNARIPAWANNPVPPLPSMFEGSHNHNPDAHALGNLLRKINDTRRSTGLPAFVSDLCPFSALEPVEEVFAMTNFTMT